MLDYKKYAYDNQETLGYKILETDNNLVKIECSVCGAKRTLHLKSLYKNKSNIHNQFCSNYYLSIIANEYGKSAAKGFHDFYRRSHERCCNPNNKDYLAYKGKFKFRDFTDFFGYCYPLYKQALERHNYKELSIDRIDGTKAYEAGNIRFVTMTENLRNKPNIHPVRAINVNTGEYVEGASFQNLAMKLAGTTTATGSLIRNCKSGKYYKKQWKIEFIETSSTIES